MAYHHGDLRQALLAAAVELIADNGVHKLSLRECARRIGVSHAAPYRHFADKEALLAAIAADGFRRLSEVGEQAMDGAGAPLDRLRAYGEAYVRFALDEPVHYRVMFTGMIEGQHEELQREGDRAFGLLAGVAAELGGDAPLVDAVTAWSLVHGLAMLMLDRRLGDPPSGPETASLIEGVVGVLGVGLGRR